MSYSATDLYINTTVCISKTIFRKVYGTPSKTNRLERKLVCPGEKCQITRERRQPTKPSKCPGSRSINGRGLAARSPPSTRADPSDRGPSPSAVQSRITPRNPRSRRPLSPLKACRRWPCLTRRTSLMFRGTPLRIFPISLKS